MTTTPKTYPMGFIDPKVRQALSSRPDKPQTFADQIVYPTPLAIATAAALDAARDQEPA